MLLAGGQGSRLGLLTKVMAKPAVVPFRRPLIGSSIFRCPTAPIRGIDTVGVLTQYQPLELNRYIGIGPAVGSGSELWRRVRAAAVHDGEERLVVSRYGKRDLPEHELHRAVRSGLRADTLRRPHLQDGLLQDACGAHGVRARTCTIAVRPVPWEIAPSFGIMSVDAENTHLRNLRKSPKHPKSNLASMGVYIFTWTSAARSTSIADEKNPKSKNDFGKNIIPAHAQWIIRLCSPTPSRATGRTSARLQAFWEANMDLLKVPPEFDLNDSRWKIYARSPMHAAALRRRRRGRRAAA